MTRKTKFREPPSTEASTLEKVLFAVTVSFIVLLIVVCADLWGMYVFRTPGTFFELALRADHSSHDHTEL